MRRCIPSTPASYGRGRPTTRFSPCPATQVIEAAASPRAAARRWPVAARTAAAPTEAQIEPSSVTPRKNRSAPGPRSRLPSRNASRSRSRPGPDELHAPTASAAPPRAAARRTERALMGRMMEDDRRRRHGGSGETRRRRLRPTDDPGGGRSEPSPPPRSGISLRQVVIAIIAVVLVPPSGSRTSTRCGSTSCCSTPQARLVTVIVVAAGLGFLIGYFVGRPAVAAQVPQGARAGLGRFPLLLRQVPLLDVPFLRERAMSQRQVRAPHAREAPRGEFARGPPRNR